MNTDVKPFYLYFTVFSILFLPLFLFVPPFLKLFSVSYCGVPGLNYRTVVVGRPHSDSDLPPHERFICCDRRPSVHPRVLPHCLSICTLSLVLRLPGFQEYQCRERKPSIKEEVEMDLGRNCFRYWNEKSDVFGGL